MQISELKATVLLSTDSGQSLSFNVSAPNRKLGSVADSAEALKQAFVKAFGEICGIAYDDGAEVGALKKKIEKLEKEITKPIPIPEASTYDMLASKPKRKYSKSND